MSSLTGKVPDYDVTNVLAAFHKRMYEERPKLMEYFRDRYNNQDMLTAALFKEIADTVISQRYGPLQTLMMGVVYGSTLGVLMEADRLERQHLIKK